MLNRNPTDDLQPKATSNASVAGMDPYVLENLMLSPELLMKRLHQAIRAVEERERVGPSQLPSQGKPLACRDE
jgi:hypothetical protein